MVLLALSLQDQVEKYGSYVGIAAFFGLAILSLLYFAQAREVKRLREWAGRAPERAREVEEAALAAAEAARRRPAPAAVPQAPAPSPSPPPRRGPLRHRQPRRAGRCRDRGGRAPRGRGARRGGARRRGSRHRGRQAPRVGDRARGAAPAEEDEDEDADEPEDAERDDEDERDEAEDADTDGDAEADSRSPRPPRPRPPTAPRRRAPSRPCSRGPAPRPASRAPARRPRAGRRRPPSPPNRPAPAMPVRPARRPRRAPSPTRRRAARLPPPASSSSGHGGRRWAIAGGVVAVIAALGVYAATQLLGDDDTHPAQPDRHADAVGDRERDGERRWQRHRRPTSAPTRPSRCSTAPRSTGWRPRRPTSSRAAATSAVDRRLHDQQRATSTIFYRRNARRQARDIGRELNISDLRAMDAETQALAGERAAVAVVVGSDKAP